MSVNSTSTSSKPTRREERQPLLSILDEPDERDVKSARAKLHTGPGRADVHGVPPNKSFGNEAYKVIPLDYTYMIESSEEIVCTRKHSAALKAAKFLGCVVTFPLSLLYVATRTRLIPEGSIGLSTNQGRPEYLGPGFHFLASPFRSLEGVVPLNTNDAIINRSQGIVTVQDGSIGLAVEKGIFVYLPPGLHQWSSPTFRFIKHIDLASGNVISLSPSVTLVQVPPGEVAITEDNGVLKMLSLNEATHDRTFLLNHAKWQFKGMLALTQQFDELQSSDLLTRDRVEVDLRSTCAWHIHDPKLAALRGGETMKQIRTLVHREAYATVSSMIATRKISDAGVGGSVRSNPKSKAATVDPAETSMACASDEQLANCNHALDIIGVTVDQISIVQLKILHDDTRRELSRLAAIPTRTKELSEVARVEADNKVIAARADAQSRLEIARAEAEAIELVARAQENAGKMLGDAESTAARLAFIEQTAKALSGTQSTIYFTEKGQGVSNLLLQQNIGNNGGGRPVRGAEEENDEE